MRRGSARFAGDEASKARPEPVIGAARMSIVLATHFDELQRGPAYVAFQGSWRLAAALIAAGTVVAIQNASRLGRILG